MARTPPLDYEAILVTLQLGLDELLSGTVSGIYALMDLAGASSSLAGLQPPAAVLGVTKREWRRSQPLAVMRASDYFYADSSGTGFSETSSDSWALEWQPSDAQDRPSP